MNRELDIQCGRALGWDIDFTGGILRAYRPDGALAYLPLYSDDPAAARQLEDEIERRGKEVINRYMDALWNIFEVRMGPYRMSAGDRYEWAFIRAVPEQRARAFLEAVRER